MEDSDDDGNERDPELMSAAEASEALFDYLVSSKLSGRTFSARSVCTIAWLATRAGAVGACGRLAANPRLSGGNHSTHFDQAIGLKDAMQERFLDVLPIPAHSKRSMLREVHHHTSCLVFDTIASEIASMDDFEAARSEAVDQLGELYSQHPIVLASPHEQFLPIALYVDAVSYTWDRKDGCMGWWIINLSSQRRHLAAVTKKSMKCRCGCRGWCSTSVCCQFLAYLLRVMLNGVYPAERYDGGGWAGHAMGDLAGQPLGYKALCVMVKGDWAEFAHTLGFYQWNHNAHPCFLCHARGGGAGVQPEEMITFCGNVSVLSLPWRLKDGADYDAACRACETMIHIPDAPTLNSIIAALDMVRCTRKWQGGRMLTRSFPALGLVQGMRLEPSDGVHDVYSIDEFIRSFPEEGLTLTFWNPACEQGTRHRNPLFHEGTGLLRTAILPDEMHTMHLGVMGDYVAKTLWRVILDDGLRVGNAGNDKISHRVRAERLNDILFAWYRSRRVDGFAVSELTDTVWSVIGTAEKPTYTGKAAPSADLVRFCASILERHHADIENGKAYLGAGLALVQYLDITRSASSRLSRSEAQGLVDAAVRFRNLADICPIKFRPKWHLMLHLVQSALRVGNPRLISAVWVDEDLNSELSCVSKHAHALVWSRRIIATFAHEAGPTARQRKVRRRTGLASRNVS